MERDSEKRMQFGYTEFFFCLHIQIENTMNLSNLTHQETREMYQIVLDV